MAMLRGLLALALALLSAAAPLPDVIPPPVSRAASSHMLQARAPPASSRTRKAHPPRQTQLLQTGTQQLEAADTTTYYVDDAGDTHIGQTAAVDNTVVPGTPGSTDLIPDEDFYLNVMYDEQEFNAVVNVTWVRPATLFTKLDYIGLYLKTDPDDAIPCNWEFAEGVGASGSVALQMTNYGDMELRYYDVAADRPRVKLALTVYPPCPNNCTNHGDCVKGKCECTPPYKGEECCLVGGSIKIELNTTKVLVGESVSATLTPPVGELDKRNWIAILPYKNETEAEMADTHMELLQTLSRAHSKLKQETPDATDVGDAPETVDVKENPPLGWKFVNDVVDIGMPHIPGQYVLKVLQNIVTHPVLGSSDVITVVEACPNDCSNHGTCVDGVCNCDEGYQNFPDCSIGDGLVNLEVSKTECLEGDLLTVTFERNSDGGFTPMDFIALFDAEDETFEAPFAYQFAQPDKYKVAPTLGGTRSVAAAATDLNQIGIPDINRNSVPLPTLLLQLGQDEDKKVDRGSVDFNAPLSNGTFVFRYFRRDHIQYAASENISVWPDCPVPSCSDHGTCVHGECVCDEGWKTFDCSVGTGNITIEHSATTLLVSSSLDVKWTRPVKVGTGYDFVAMYNTDAPNDQPLSYAYAHDESAPDGGQSGTVTLPVPHVPGIYSIRYIDAFSRETVAAANDIDVHLPCPNACSGHGTCVKDTCNCQTEWTAKDDCSAKIGVTEITAAPLALVTPGPGEITVSYKRPEGSGSDVDFIGLFRNGTSGNRRPVDFKIPGGNDFGTAKFSVPAVEGMYQVRYIGGPTSEVRAKSLSIEVTKACLNDCTGHGTCNRGVCTCIGAWEGEDCSIGVGPTTVSVGPKLGNPGDTVVITYTRPANTGTAEDFLAIYPKGTKDMATPYQFVLATAKDSDSVEATMPNVEEELEVHYVRAKDQTSAGVSGPFSVVFPCPEDCNAHGDCNKGVCNCYSGWDGMSCNRQIPTAFALRLVTSGTVEPMGSATFAWDLVPALASAGDFVGLFAVTDAQSTTPLTYEYTGMQPSGQASLMAPQQPGDYVARYICNKDGGMEVKAESTTLSVVAPPKSCPDDCSNHGTCDTSTGECSCEAGWAGANCATQVPTEFAVVADAKQYLPGGYIEARWMRPPDQGNYQDRIFMAKVGSSDPVQFQYTGVGNTGTLYFSAPTPTGQTAGSYQLKFGNGETGTVEAQSEPFTVLNDGTSAHNAAARHR